MSSVETSISYPRIGSMPYSASLSIVSFVTGTSFAAPKRSPSSFTFCSIYIVLSTIHKSMSTFPRDSIATPSPSMQSSNRLFWEPEHPDCGGLAVSSQVTHCSLSSSAGTASRFWIILSQLTLRLPLSWRFSDHASYTLQTLASFMVPYSIDSTFLGLFCDRLITLIFSAHFDYSGLRLSHILAKR